MFMSSCITGATGKSVREGDMGVTGSNTMF